MFATKASKTESADNITRFIGTISATYDILLIGISCALITYSTQYLFFLAYN